MWCGGCDVEGCGMKGWVEVVLRDVVWMVERVRGEEDGWEDGGLRKMEG